MSEHPNAALARQVWEAISRGDAESLRELVSPDLIWHATALRTPWSGARRGYDAVLDFLARVGEMTDSFDAKWIDVLTSEERVLVIYHVALGVGSRRTALDYLLLGRVQGGRLAEIWTAPLDPAAIEGFWAGSA